MANAIGFLGRFFIAIGITKIIISIIHFYRNKGE